jgi:hypothetical protein
VRGEAAPEPHNFPQSRTRNGQSANVDLAAHKTRTRIGRVREQSAVAFSPQPLSVRDRSRARDLSVSTSSPSPRTVREQAADNLARSNFCAEIPRLMREPKNLNLLRGKACPEINKDCDTVCA